jgi:hypothetical protein
VVETFGRYQLVKTLATGGMAELFLARQVGPQGAEKLLVVKRILPHLSGNEEFTAMFLDEARIAARLDHPNIVQIFDLGVQDERYFLAMEYIHGEDLRRVWRQAERLGQPLPQSLVCRIIIEACAGLDHAHKRTDQAGRPLGIIHRDVSPQNILVSFEGGVKVVDFGIAKAADAMTVTRAGVLKGKYAYMSPEQAAGQPLDHRSDVFALGVVLYELLTATRLFKRPTDLQTLEAVLECQLEPPWAVDARVPRDLGALVLRALAKDRTQRFPEACQLGAALEAWLLRHQLPSSASHLAAFMRHLYAERLAGEAAEGPFPEHVEAAVQVRVPASPGPGEVDRDRPTRALRAPAADPARDVAPPPAPGQVSTTILTVQEGPGPRRPVGLAAGVALVAVASAAALLTMPMPVRASTSPGGAAVQLDGAPGCPATPCELLVPRGAHRLRFTLDGYRPAIVELEVPLLGGLDLPGVVLIPAP